MRRSISSLALFSLTMIAVGGSRSVRAQAVSPVRIGIEGGYNSATVSGDAAVDVSHRNAFNVGATLTVPVTAMFGIQPELLFTGKGAAVPSEAGSVKINYVQIPLLARLNLTAPNAVTPYVVAGPAIAFKTSCTLEGSVNGTSASSSCDDAGVPTSSVDYSVIGGAGLSFTRSSYRATVGARYDYGFKNIAGDAATIKNRVWSILVGAEVPIGK